jgi:ABC-2 type transport system permease protein
MTGEVRNIAGFPTQTEAVPARVSQGSQFIGLYARELLRTFRNPWVLVITIAQPFMWLAFFGSSFAAVPLDQLEELLHTPIESYTQFLLPGILSTSMLSIGMFGAMSTIQDKRFGYMKRILLTPTAKATVYLAKATGSATRGLVQVPVMIAAAVIFGVTLNGNGLMWAGWLLGLALLGFGFSCVFLAITASSTDWQTPGVIANFITMPLMFASGALFPTVNFPPWMQAISAINPVTYSALLGRDVILTGTWNWAYFGYLVAFAAAMAIIGTLVARRYLKIE